jgi:hypothetical protein
MDGRAMKFANLCANKAFSILFSWLLGQPVKDTLCGTKALWRADYERIERGRSYFGDFDPFGDFDLLFGADKQNLKIVDVPIRYKERFSGNQYPTVAARGHSPPHAGFRGEEIEVRIGDC